MTRREDIAAMHENTLRIERIEAMRYPVRCRFCSHIHDGATVTVELRYTDCSCWRCPSCDVLIDDRPLAWGGSAIRVDTG